MLDELDAPVERIVVTHMHPDHVGGAADVAELTGAPVLQGRADYAQCVQRVGRARPAAVRRLLGLARHARRGRSRGSRASPSGSSHAVHWVRDPQLLDAGDEIDGWRVEVLPGHADGHIVLLRDGVMIAGDTILGGITPAIGLYPELAARPARRLPRDAASGSRSSRRASPTRGTRSRSLDPAGRAREISSTTASGSTARPRALDGVPLSAYDVSLALFERDLSPTLRRFATAESLAHLERLVREGRAERVERRYISA